eukprot:gene9266-10868_t
MSRLDRFDTHTNETRRLGNMKYHVQSAFTFIIDRHIYIVGGYLRGAAIMTVDIDTLNIRTFIYSDAIMASKGNPAHNSIRACYDQENYVYIINKSEFVRVSLRSKHVKPLVHPGHSDESGLVVYDGYHNRIYCTFGDKACYYSITSDKWRSLANPPYKATATKKATPSPKTTPLQPVTTTKAETTPNTPTLASPSHASRLYQFDTLTNTTTYLGDPHYPVSGALVFMVGSIIFIVGGTLKGTKIATIDVITLQQLVFMDADSHDYDKPILWKYQYGQEKSANFLIQAHYVEMQYYTCAIFFKGSTVFLMVKMLNIFWYELLHAEYVQANSKKDHFNEALQVASLRGRLSIVKHITTNHPVADDVIIGNMTKCLEYNQQYILQYTHFTDVSIISPLIKKCLYSNHTKAAMDFSILQCLQVLINYLPSDWAIPLSQHIESLQVIPHGTLTWPHQ